MKYNSIKYSKELAAFAYIQEEYVRTGDVIAGLIPIFSPIIHKCAGQRFNPTTFAEMVRHSYDIEMRPIVAESLIPKLVEVGLLIETKISEYSSTYRCARGPNIVHQKTEQDVEDLLNEFCQFAERALSLQQITIPEEELRNSFLKRLMEMKFVNLSNENTESTQVSSSGNNIDDAPEVKPAVQREVVLDSLSAEYITHLAETNPPRFEFMESMVAGALIADVVLTLQQPAGDTNLDNLTVVIDSPLIMDALDLSTPEQAKYAQDLIDLLSKSKIKLITFKHLVAEMRSSIYAPLNAHLQGEYNYGPLANRFRFDTTHVAYARAVHDGIEDFIGNLNITLEDAAKYESPEYLSYCPEDIVDSIRNCLNPLFDKVERRSRDAISVATIMRMRQGHQSKASVTESKYVLATRNVGVALSTNRCILAKGLISLDDVPPCILDRQLACVLWLCLGGSINQLTREKLLANCIGALYPRPNLLSTVRMFLGKIDIKKVQIFETLMRDQRAQRCLIHKTHGNSSMVSQDNVEELLEELKRSIIIEVEQEAQQREKRLRAESEMAISAQCAELSFVRSNADQLEKGKAELLERQDEFIQTLLERACIAARVGERTRKATVLAGYFISVSAVTYFSTKFDRIWIPLIVGVVACIGFWFVPDRLFKKWIKTEGNRIFDYEIGAAKIEDYGNCFEINRDSWTVLKK